jgi:hypothetical protein
MTVWLVFKITREQYGEEGVVGVYSTEEIAKRASDMPGEQTRIEEFRVDELMRRSHKYAKVGK